MDYYYLFLVLSIFFFLLICILVHHITNEIKNDCTNFKNTLDDLSVFENFFDTLSQDVVKKNIRMDFMMDNLNKKTTPIEKKNTSLEEIQISKFHSALNQLEKEIVLNQSIHNFYKPLRDDEIEKDKTKDPMFV